MILLKRYLLAREEGKEGRNSMMITIKKTLTLRMILMMNLAILVHVQRKRGSKEESKERGEKRLLWD